MNEKIWKKLAITLTVVCIIQFIMLGWVMYETNKLVENEGECYSICEEGGYFVYDYDAYEEVCKCYGKDFELIESVYMGD